MSIKVLPLRAFQLVCQPFNGRAVFGHKLGSIPLVKFFYDRTSRGLTPDSVTTRINGYLIKTNFSMGGIARCIVEQGEYEPLTTKLFIEKAKSGHGVVVDVGANIGYYSLLAATILPDTGILAFEPEAGNQLILRENISLNRFANVRAFPVALSDSNGRCQLYTSKSESGEHNIIGSHGLVDSTCTVTTKRLDAVCDQPVRLIKIDVEGAEVMVLRGAEKVLSAYHPTLFVECWGEGLAKAGSSVEELLSLLHSHGYSVSMIDEFGGVIRLASEDAIKRYDSDYHFSVNLLCETA